MLLTPDYLTLSALRRYIRQSGVGHLRLIAGDPDWEAPLGPATNDSRDLTPGGLFVALQGEQADGHRFVADAYARGAAAMILAHLPDADLATAEQRGSRALPPLVVWLAPDPLQALQGFAGWWRVHFADLRVIGITGSVGKTTAKEVLAGALRTRLDLLASPRSFNNEIGLPLTLLSLRGSHRAAILEMGIFDVGDIRLLAGMARHGIGVVLNVEAVHVERCGSIERVQQAKQEMVETLQPGGVSVLNRDDPRVWAMTTVAPGPVRSFGLEQGADWQGLDLRPLPEGLALTLVHQGVHYPVQTALPGRHHAYALLAAAAVMDVLGYSPEEIVQALTAVPALAARQRILHCGGGWLVIDDSYNASPLSMVAALDLLAAQKAPRRVAILADMLELGEVEVSAHLQLGLKAARAAELVLAVGPLAAGIAEGAGPRGRHFPDKAALRTQLAALLAPGDAILVKGSRGMKMEEVVAWLCQANS